MTYCLAIKVDNGLVFASDSRTSASMDDVRTYGKMHVFEYDAERFFVLLSAGNLATTQAVIEQCKRDAEDESAEQSLRRAETLFDAAQYIGALNSRAQRRIAEERAENPNGLGATFILGGQVQGGEAGIYLIYNLGNCITTSPETNFLQIGESKYGKPILDRVVTHNVSLEDAARCALISLDATMRSNISVGPPLELLVYRNGSFSIGTRMKLEAADPFFTEFRQSWNAALTEALDAVPRFPWEDQMRAMANVAMTGEASGAENLVDNLQQVASTSAEVLPPK